MQGYPHCFILPRIPLKSAHPFPVCIVQNTRAGFQCPRVVKEGRRCAYAGPIVIIPARSSPVEEWGWEEDSALGSINFPCQNPSASSYIHNYGHGENFPFFFWPPLNLSDRYLCYVSYHTYVYIPTGFKLRGSCYNYHEDVYHIIGDMILN